MYVIAEFSNTTVSSVPKKWKAKLGKKKKMWFPNSGALAKIKAAVDVDKNSKKWSLHDYRLLMNGDTFATYKEARAAEIIAQSHSTMESFEKSYMRKQEARKKPTVIFDSPSSSSSRNSECSDFKKIRKLQKVDAGLDVNANKEYGYTDPLKKVNDWIDSNRDGTGNDELQSSVDGSAQLSEPDQNDSHNEKSTIDGDQTVNDELQSSVDGSEQLSERDQNDSNDENSINDGNRNEDFSSGENSSIKSVATDNNCFYENSKHLTRTDNCNSSQLPFESTNLESLGPIHDYNSFNAERRIQHIERSLKNANEQLHENNKLLTEMVESQQDVKMTLQGLTQTIKDLAVEVFDNKAELKKRNGLFTDLLAPQIRLPIKNVNRYKNVECELLDYKIVDNLIKYFGSTINESNENGFIKACLKIIFTEKFLLKKVWWKKEDGKAFFKKSQLLHCIRESYKIKFGLVEPKKSDKAIESLIHKICTNMKDTMRKAKKAEKAKQVGAYENDLQLEMAIRATEQAKQVNTSTGDETTEEVEYVRKKVKAKKVGKNSAEMEMTDHFEDDELNRISGAEMSVVEVSAERKKKRKKKHGKDFEQINAAVEVELNVKKRKRRSDENYGNGTYVKKHRSGTSLKKTRN